MGACLTGNSYSDALAAHLHAIDPLLTHPSSITKTSGKGDGGDGSDGGDEGDGSDTGGDGDNSELEATCDDQAHPHTSLAFLAGLHLTVLYFRSIYIIKNFLAKYKLESITINTMTVLHQGGEMLPWAVSLSRWLPPGGSATDDLLVATIAKVVETLEQRGKLQAVLAGFTKLSAGKGFSGTLHCEACMATFMHLARANSPVLAEVGKGLEALTVESPILHSALFSNNIVKECQCHWGVEAVLPSLQPIASAPAM